MRNALFVPAALVAALSTGCAAKPDALNTPTEPNAATSTVKTLQVAPSRVACTGVAPQLCLQVRATADAPWTLLYGPIEGFDYEAGFLYEIRVREEAVANPPADGSSIRRTLLALISKTPALVGPTWRLTSIGGKDALAGVRVTAVFGDANRFSGNGGCNSYSGAADVKGERLEVGRLAATVMACATSVMDQEQAYFTALAKVTSYRLANNELRLGPAVGVSTLVFRAE